MKKFILPCFGLLLAIMMLVWCTNTRQWDYDYLVLVNKQHKLPSDWEANVQLVEVQNAYDETIKVEKEALEKYYELRDALLEEWVDIELDSAYRSVSRQEELRAEFEEKYGIDYTKTYVAVPWYSEHHTALAIDICIIKDWVLIYENDDMMAEPEIFAKVHAKLADYGFILRYLEWKEDITWYGYEPRHLRYVWSVDVAREIMDNWLTLEEYLGEEPSLYPIAEQVCADNGWEVTVDDEWTPICLLWWRGINLADMEEHPENDERVESLTFDNLQEIAQTNFPKYSTYTIVDLQTEEIFTWENLYMEDTPHNLTNITPHFGTIVNHNLLSSGIEDEMIYSNFDVTFNDGTDANILYINNPETLDFVAATVEIKDFSSINYQFVY